MRYEFYLNPRENFHYIYTSGHYTEDSYSVLKYPEYWEFSK